MKEKFPEERRERFIYRLKKVRSIFLTLSLALFHAQLPKIQVVVEQQRHPDYQDAVGECH